MSLKKWYSVFYYQFLVSCRSRESVFFTIILSPLLFVIFGMAFRIDEEYAKFFLPGMIASTACSDALYAVGPVIKNYFSMNIVRYFKGYPVNLSSLFVGFILTRLIFILVSTLILIAVSVFIFGFQPSFVDLARYFLGVIFIFSIYSFIALTISFYGIKDSKDQGITGIYYMLTIFLSDAFFVLSKANLTFDIVGYFFPLKTVLIYMRGDIFYLVFCCGWLFLSFVIFYFRIKKLQLTR